MKLTRKFVTGTDNVSESTGIGEFEYEVERSYNGEAMLVGGSVLAMNGGEFEVCISVVLFVSEFWDNAIYVFLSLAHKFTSRCSICFQSNKKKFMMWMRSMAFVRQVPFIFLDAHFF